MGSLSLITEPAQEPITFDEAKSHCRVDVADDDALISGLIVAARQHVENVTGRQLITATWALKLDWWPHRRGEYGRTGEWGWPSSWIDVPRAPLLSTPAVAITYLDTAGATQTLATNQYRVDAPSGPTASRGTIEPAYGVTWPSLYSVSNSVTVTFTAGYGASPDTVPQAIRQAMLVWMLPEYQRRPRDKDEVRAFNSLIAPYKTWARWRS